MHFPVTAKEGSCLRLWSTEYTIPWYLPCPHMPQKVRTVWLFWHISVSFSFSCPLETTLENEAPGFGVWKQHGIELRALVPQSHKPRLKSCWMISRMVGGGHSLPHPQYLIPRVGLPVTPADLWKEIKERKEVLGLPLISKVTWTRDLTSLSLSFVIYIMEISIGLLTGSNGKIQVQNLAQFPVYSTYHKCLLLLLPFSHSWWVVLTFN